MDEFVKIIAPVVSEALGVQGGKLPKKKAANALTAAKESCNPAVAQSYALIAIAEELHKLNKKVKKDD